MSAQDFETRPGLASDAAAPAPGTDTETDTGNGPVIEETAWGYIIRASDADQTVRAAGSVAGRFVGAILLMAAAGLWLMPDALHGAELFAIKFASMVMFSVLGGYFVWTGRHAFHPEYRVDLEHHEIRIGQRDSGNKFRQTARIDFHNVSSVFLLRSKDHRPTRLFLRLADLDTGIEIATGNRTRMEALKQRLTDDLSGQVRQTVVRQLGRHQHVAA